MANIINAIGTFIKSNRFNLTDSNNAANRMNNCGNNPPDFMLSGGDAVEVKKIESPDAALALNSSYPKHTLKSSSPLISTACREAENLCMVIAQCKAYNSSLRGKFDVELSVIPALKCFDNRNPKCDRLFRRRV